MALAAAAHRGMSMAPRVAPMAAPLRPMGTEESQDLPAWRPLSTTPELAAPTMIGSIAEVSASHPRP